MTNNNKLVAAGLSIWLLAACAAATPAPTAVPPTPLPTATAVPPTPVPTATAVPPTPVPTATAVPPTPVPTATAVPPTKAPTPTAVPPTATAAKKVPTATPEPAAVEPARPSNAGGPGAAANLKGDVVAGAKVFTDNCQKCHGDQGKVGKDNPGSKDGTVPVLNPIDETLIDHDPKVTITNLDLFIEHGSTPEGADPKLTMTAFGDEKKLTPQQIANVIAYVMSLNK